MFRKFARVKNIKVSCYFKIPVIIKKFTFKETNNKKYKEAKSKPNKRYIRY